MRRTYPEFCWRCSEFSPIKNGFWEKEYVANHTIILTISSDHVISFFDRLGARFGVRTLEDWYKITVDNISEVPGGDNLIRKHFGGSLALTLKKVRVNPGVTDRSRCIHSSCGKTPSSTGLRTSISQNR